MRMAIATAMNDRLRIAKWLPGAARRQTALCDVDQRADRCIRPDLAGRSERHLDATQALGEAILSAREGVKRVAAVEVADVLDAGIVVVAAVGVGAAHRGDPQV